jgi:hypothetical protein
VPKSLPQTVKDNLSKCRSAAIAAVDAYNRPGPRFRTAQFIVLVVIAWTAFFHAVFYRRGRRPWYQRKQSKSATGIRYVKIDGEPKHWDLSESLKQYFGDKTPPERKNIEFLIGLRNKIEHRHLPQLDPALYGECQATLLNLEDLLFREFGGKYALSEDLVVALQFSSVVTDEKRKALKTLASSASKSVREYVEKFRAGLPGDVLNSMKYSFSVYLVPRVANRENAADFAVQFVKVDEASPEELERLERLNVLIREKHIPILNLGLHKPKDVVRAVKARLPYYFTINIHTSAWRHFAVRPSSADPHPERTLAQYCIWDKAHGDYLYTDAWIEKLVKDLSEPATYITIAGGGPWTA